MYGGSKLHTIGKANLARYTISKLHVIITLLSLSSLKLNWCDIKSEIKTFSLFYLLFLQDHHHQEWDRPSINWHHHRTEQFFMKTKILTRNLDNGVSAVHGAKMWWVLNFQVVKLHLQINHSRNFGTNRDVFQWEEKWVETNMTLSSYETPSWTAHHIRCSGDIISVWWSCHPMKMFTLCHTWKML